MVMMVKQITIQEMAFVHKNNRQKGNAYEGILIPT